MAKLPIIIGTAGNDGTGESIRSAFEKVNANFNELYTAQTRLVQLSDSQIANLSPINGDLVYNTTTNQIQGFQNGLWVDISYTGNITSGVWIQAPSSYRLAITGTGTVSIASKDFNDVITDDAIVYTVSNVNNEIHTFLAGDTKQIKLIFPSSLTVNLQ